MAFSGWEYNFSVTYSMDHENSKQNFQSIFMTT